MYYKVTSVGSTQMVKPSDGAGKCKEKVECYIK